MPQVPGLLSLHMQRRVKCSHTAIPNRSTILLKERVLSSKEPIRYFYSPSSCYHITLADLDLEVDLELELKLHLDLELELELDVASLSTIAKPGNNPNIHKQVSG